MLLQETWALEEASHNGYITMNVLAKSFNGRSRGQERFYLLDFPEIACICT